MVDLKDKKQGVLAKTVDQASSPMFSRNCAGPWSPSAIVRLQMQSKMPPSAK